MTRCGHCGNAVVAASLLAILAVLFLKSGSGIKKGSAVAGPFSEWPPSAPTTRHRKTQEAEAEESSASSSYDGACVGKKAALILNDEQRPQAHFVAQRVGAGMDLVFGADNWDKYWLHENATIPSQLAQTYNVLVVEGSGYQWKGVRSWLQNYTSDLEALATAGTCLLLNLAPGITYGGPETLPFGVSFRYIYASNRGDLVGNNNPLRHGYSDNVQDTYWGRPFSMGYFPSPNGTDDSLLLFAPLIAFRNATLVMTGAQLPRSRVLYSAATIPYYWKTQSSGGHEESEQAENVRLNMMDYLCRQSQ